MLGRLRVHFLVFNKCKLECRHFDLSVTTQEIKLLLFLLLSLYCEEGTKIVNVAQKMYICNMYILNQDL